ncbi:MAG: glycoside hydrolase family 1 protein [Candidatus Yanofskybacteria bacterium]|nr:glycoside hydrolase family 1 protein [Candidatus Yanofskybacteria bacterium]
MYPVRSRARANAVEDLGRATLYGMYFGSATSSHQVEGGNANNWSVWEEKNADRLAREAERNFGKLHSWPEIKLQAQNPRNYISGVSSDHYNRFEQDFDIAKSLGHNAHRFSIEWSRIELEEGQFNQEAIEHYKKVSRTLHERGMEPFVTLWHWTVPLWFEKKGGWESPQAADAFSRYVEKVISSLPDVKFWITLNEPEIFALNSFYRGIWPPQKKSALTALKVVSNLIEAQKKAYGAIKQLRPDAQVGISKNNTYFESNRNPINRVFKSIADWAWNRYIPDKLKGFQDFIGLNYYFHNRINFGFNRNRNERVSDLGWEIFPEGIYHTLKQMQPYKLPVYITENGLADAADSQRAQFIREHLDWVRQAIQEGCNVQGYFYWSLLDNFEWDKGFWPRFGLVEVDYVTLERKIRPSALAYKKLIESWR